MFTGRVSRLIITLLLLMAAQTVFSAQGRVALVIGNADYESEQPLANTLNDARDVSAKLTALGFEVTKVENASRRTLGRAVTDFLRRVQGSDAVALLYYSGHGLQVNGNNYLIPVDARIKDELDVPLEGLAVNQLLGGMAERGENAINLVILDACRDNPFKRAGNKSIGDKGLARIAAPSGTLILYATRPGETASDNPAGRNGLFTKHLLAALDQPGEKIEESFKQVAKSVYQDSHKAQSPWQEGVIYGEFYFQPSNGTLPPPPPPVPLGYLQVVVDVDDAEVSIDGQVVGKASAGKALNLGQGLPVGAVEVQVTAAGRREVRREKIRAGQWTQVVVALSGREHNSATAQRAAPPAPPRRGTEKSLVATITYPAHGDAVSRSVYIEGNLSGPHGGGRNLFLMIRSRAFGKRYYPQGEIENSGRWSLKGIYGTPGYKYETFVVATNNQTSAALLCEKRSRSHGLKSLPPDTEIISSTIVVKRK